ncbi:MAG: hypothetical protein QM754_17805 [Tepidisphaeraceae bacterium]
MTFVTIFAMLCAAAGWYYMLHADKAEDLSGFERPNDNRLRIRLRRWNGVLLVVMALAFYVGFRIADKDAGPLAIAICLGAVLILLPVVLFLAYVDIRLTRKMKAAHQQQKPK